jgi:hypothetical protein
MTHLPGRDAYAHTLTELSCDAFAPSPLLRHWIDDTTVDSHDGVMRVSGESNLGAGSTPFMDTISVSCCSGCDAGACWQSDPREPTLHLSAEGFDVMDGAADAGAVQVNPFNPDITPNEWSGR